MAERWIPYEILIIRFRIADKSIYKFNKISYGMETEEKPNGALFGLIVIIIILIIGGIYILRSEYKSFINKTPPVTNQTE
jgi:hypothetical protein